MNTIRNYIMLNGLRFVTICLIALFIIGLIVVLLVFLYNKMKQDSDLDSYSIFSQDRDLNLCRKRSCDTGKMNHKIFKNRDIKDVMKDGANSLNESAFDFRGVDFDIE